MSNSRLLLAPLLLAAGLCSCAGHSVKPSTPTPGAAPDPEPGTHQTIPLVGKLKVERYVLDNGLRLLVVEDHESPTFSYETWFRVGSRDEEPGRTGLAHLFEHMMFKSTRNHKDGDFEKIMDSAGAEGNNAFTSLDYTAYVQELPKDKLEMMAGLESDRMVNLLVDDAVFKTEREVVQNERRMRHENSPDSLIHQELFAQAYTSHSYKWPVIGYETDLNAMSAEDARNFYRAHYSPNHATVVICGDVVASDAYRLIKRYYGGLPAVESPPHEIPVEPAQKAPRRKNLTFNIQLEKIMMGFHMPQVGHPDMPALDVLQGVLAGGRSSRLQRALVDMGVAADVSADDMEEKDPALFIISASLQKGKHAADAEFIIRRELKRIADEGVSEPELERVRNRTTFGFYEGMDTNSERSRWLGYYETVANGFEIGLKQIKDIASVTPAQVQGVARKYLSPDNGTVITGVPK